MGRIIGEYVYNGAGDRLAQEVNGRRTEYLLDASHPLTEVVGAFGAGEPTYYLLGLDVIGSQTGQDWSYFGYDGLGSTRFTTNQAGTLTSATRYDPYGGVLDQVNAINTNLGFAGEFTDANGLINLRARFYSPSLGTFLNRDPVLGLVGGHASHWNPYVYVHGNPVNVTDPSGKLAPLLVGMGIAALGGGVVGGLAGGGINLVSQLMSHRGNFACVNWGDVTNAAFDGMIMGGIGGMVGFLAGPSALGLGVAAAADVAIGTAYDTLRYGTPPSESLMNNMIALGLGQGVGVAVKKAFKAAGSDVVNEVLHGRLSVSRLGRSLRGVGDDVVGGLRGAADDVGRLLRGRLRPAGGALDWDDGFGPRVLRMADGSKKKPQQDYLPGFEPEPKQLSLFTEAEYGELDEFGRATYARGYLEHPITEGSVASRRILVPDGFHRGHLLARSLGGDGKDVRNIVPLYPKPNQEAMQAIEGQVARTVKSRQVVEYRAFPVYLDDSPIPHAITIRARGLEGKDPLDIAISILNWPFD